MLVTNLPALLLAAENESLLILWMNINHLEIRVNLPLLANLLFWVKNLFQRRSLVHSLALLLHLV